MWFIDMRQIRLNGASQFIDRFITPYIACQVVTSDLEAIRWSRVIVLTAMIAPLNILLFVSSPPLLYVDSQIQLFYTFELALRQYGVLYPILVRSISNVIHDFGSLALVLSGGWREATWYLSLNQPAPYTDISVSLILIFQHAFFSFSVAFLAATVGRRCWQQILIVLLFLSQPDILFQQQGLLTESIWLSFILISFSFLVRYIYFDSNKLFNFSFHYLFICLALVTRHQGAIMFALLPMVLGCFWAAKWIFRSDHSPGTPSQVAKLTGVCLVVAGIAFITFSQANRVILALYGVKYVSPVGRATTYRMSPMVQQAHATEFGFSPEVFRVAGARLLETIDDPTVREAFEIIANDRSPWTGSYSIIYKEIVTRECPQCSNSEKNSRTDEILNAVAKELYFSSDRVHLSEVISRIKFYLVSGWEKNPLRTIFQWLIDDRTCETRNFRIFEDKGFWGEIHDGLRVMFFDGVSMINNQNMSRYLTVLNCKPIKSIQSMPKIYYFIGGLLTLIFFAGIGRLHRWDVIIGLSLMVTSLAYIMAMSVFTIYLARYSEVVTILLLCAWALGIGRIQGAKR